MSAPLVLQSDTGEQTISLGSVYEGFPPDPDLGWPGVSGLGIFYPASGSAPYPAFWVKNARNDAWAGPYSAPAGPPGNAGPAGALGQWQSGSTFQALTSTVLVRQSIWQCLVDHIAGATFEADAIAGRWQIVNSPPVETFSPYLATSPQAVATQAPGATVFQRTPGGGVVTKFYAYCVAAPTGGNTQIAVYRTAAGAPAAQAAISGVVTAVAATMLEFTMSDKVVVYPNDLLAIYCDNTGATFYAVSSFSNASFPPMMTGTTYFQNTTPPANAAGLNAAARRGFLIVGR